MSPIEHVLHRPGMYVGAVNPTDTHTWTLDPLGRLTYGRVTMVPALLKIFDEILVNACDNKARDATMRHLDVRFKGLDTGEPTISVTNDGSGVPIEWHSKEGAYVPELVFGHMLSGSNFDDDVGHTTGGRHGYGAKLTNIFSKEFTVTTFNAATRRLYRQTWKGNMNVRGEPSVLEGAAAVAEASKCRPFSGSGDFTRVEFVPDLSRFGGKTTSSVMDVSTAALMRRRVVDAAGLLGESVTVTLDGQRVATAGWRAYTHLFTPSSASVYDPPATPATPPAGLRDASTAMPPEAARQILSALTTTSLEGGWEVSAGVAGILIETTPSPSPPAAELAGTQQHAENSASLELYNEPCSFSFVNGMATPRGGTHADFIVDQIARRCAVLLSKRAPDLHITPAVVKQHLRVFVNARVENPSFDSQAKEQLMTEPANFFAVSRPGKDVQDLLQLPEKFIRTLLDDVGVAGAVLGHVRSKAQADAARSVKRALKGNDQKIKAIPKLEDANLAGSRRGHECTLILTEGDSAKALAVAGLAVVGRDRYGVFPLRGKLLNVRELEPKAAVQNAEVAALVSILGLDFKQTYEGLAPAERGLRYGRVMIMTDQDVDGSHIKGLVINLFHTFWPKLLSSRDGDGFLEQFITPIIKARKGAALKEFYSIAEFQRWRDELRASDGMRGWSVKYYKGLGTSTSLEGRSYFSRLDTHRKPFIWSGPRDEERILMAFAKDKVDERKQWLLARADDAVAQSTAGTPVSAHMRVFLPSPTLPGGVEASSGVVAGERALPGSPPAPGAKSTTPSATSFTDFVDAELIDFSRADLVRSIPSVLDGLKPSQRKVLYACFKRAGRAGMSATPGHGPASDVDPDRADEAHIGAPRGGPTGSEIKVAQLAGYVAEQTAYHHGEAALVNTIVNMAQDFVGSNNLPLLQPLGQFGTRLQGGKDAASARYIFTRLSPVSRLLFPPVDDPLLRRRDDDGDPVEPAAYIPIIPLLLVNGAAGIGTGWSTFIPGHDPLRVIDATAKRLASSGAGLDDMIGPPWWHKFAGTVMPSVGGGGFTITGAAEWTDGYPTSSGSGARAKVTTRAKRPTPAVRRLSTARKGTASQNLEQTASRGKARGAVIAKDEDDDDAYASVGQGESLLQGPAGAMHVRISELPVGRWTEDYKAFLLGLVSKELLKGFKEYHTEARAEFVVEFAPQGLRELESVHAGDLLTFFKLTTAISTKNMHAFDAHGRIQRYATAEAILEAFMPARAALYHARKLRMEQQLRTEEIRLRSKARFLEAIIRGELKLARPRSEVTGDLWRMNFPVFQSGSDAFAHSQQLLPLPPAVQAISHLLDADALQPDAVIEPAQASRNLPEPLQRQAYEYLLSLPLSQLTSESVGKARDAASRAAAQLKHVLGVTPEALWQTDLAALRAHVVSDMSRGDSGS